MQMLVVVVSLLWCLACLQVVTAQMPRNPVIRYDFDRESCHQGWFENQAEFPLAINWTGSDVQCSKSFGIERVHDENFVHLRTDKFPVSLLSATAPGPTLEQARGISFVVWFEPFEESFGGSGRPILTLHNPDRTTDEISSSHSTTSTTLAATSGCTVADKLVDFQILQKGDYIEVLYGTADALFEPCQRVLLTTTKLIRNQLNHMVISLGQEQQSFFVNGFANPTLQAAFQHDLSHWDSEVTLGLLSFDNLEPWIGRLYRVALYGDAITENDALSSIMDGPPKVAPYATPKRVVILEDSTMESKSSGVLDTSRPSQQMHAIELPFKHLDDELQVLLSTLNLSNLNHRPVSAFITQYPKDGTLYSSDGVTIRPPRDPNATSIIGTFLSYNPPPNAHSALPGLPLASFQFCVSVSPFFHQDACHSAPVHIIVESRNDPPIPIARPTFVELFDTQSRVGRPLMELTGTDIDEGDSISYIQITHPPKYGDLLISVLDRAQMLPDNIHHGVMLSEQNYTVAAQSIFLEYKYRTHASTNLSIVEHSADNDDESEHPQFVEDVFHFRVADKSRTWSDGIMVTLNILPSLRMGPQPDILVHENAATVFELRTKDHSPERRSIGFVLTSVPEQGFLFEDSEKPLEAEALLNQRSDFPYWTGAQLTFIPPSGACDDATTSAVFSFSFRAITWLDDAISSKSEIVTQFLHLQCSERALSLSIPEDDYYIETFDDYVDDRCHGYSYHNNSNFSGDCDSAAIINGINVTVRKSDYRQHQTFVSVSCSHGLLTLSKEHSDFILPLFDHTQMRGSIQFRAPAQHLTNALQQLHYQSNSVGTDTIILAIFYGDCAQMKSRAQSTGWPTQDKNCHNVTETMLVHVSARPEDELDSSVVSGFQWMSLPFTIALTVFMKIRGRRRRIASMPILVDDDHHLSISSLVDVALDGDQVTYANDRRH